MVPSFSLPDSVVAPRIAIQGVQGSFSDLAARSHWPTGVEIVPAPTFDGALANLRNGRADFAILPVENLIVGPVVASVQAIAAARDTLQEVAVVRFPIQMCLLGMPGSTLESVTRVQSHPVALAQCTQFLRAHGGMAVVPHEDTAGAARAVVEAGVATVGAIASAAAADYGLVVLAEGIQDRPDNWTRFVVLART